MADFKLKSVNVRIIFKSITSGCEYNIGKIFVQSFIDHHN